MSSELFNTLESMIFDEKKLVTHTMLGHKLNISSNLAKRMLYELTKRKKEQVHAVYMLLGLKNGVITFQLAPQQILEQEESKFDKIISKYVYCVGLEIPDDSSRLWINIHSELTNQEISESLQRVSSIRFTECKDEKAPIVPPESSISQSSGTPHSNVQVIPYDELINTEKMGTNDPSMLVETETNTKKRTISQVEPKPENDKKKSKKTAAKAKGSGNMSIKAFFSKASS